MLSYQNFNFYDCELFDKIGRFLLNKVFFIDEKETKNILFLEQFFSESINAERIGVHLPTS